MIIRHLSDSQLLMTCQPVQAEERQSQHDCVEHLGDCADCRARRTVVARLLDDAKRAAEVDTDDAFPLERLAQQRDRILARVDDLCHAGKILTFPSAHPRSVPTQPSHRTRWVAAAAAAGLVVGLLGGHLTRDFSSRPGLHARHAGPSGLTLRPALQIQSEDELLDQVEVAFEGTGPSALRPLDALTPVAWDVR